MKTASYTHKGIEKMAEGKPYAEGLTLAEHVCGLCAFAHSTAFCQTMEALLGIELPNTVLTIRAILLEMERLASHLADLTAICSSGGFGFASVRAAYFRELILQMNQQLVGHRFLRGFNQVGGVQKAIRPLA
ncbi:MAG: nickel-dependent hydrogenase large subunit [Candidatus Melainabacteria bacterium]|jgi:Ni,Fe-hydrogenase III large subunit|nr:nickel-dependent hydrogenase large subunit [Candidatus Melainabacteria bacterium]